MSETIHPVASLERSMQNERGETTNFEVSLFQMEGRHDFVVLKSSRPAGVECLVYGLDAVITRREAEHLKDLLASLFAPGFIESCEAFREDSEK